MHDMHGGSTDHTLLCSLLQTNTRPQVLTRGIACATANCKTRMHTHCFATYRKRHAACPSCKESWANAEVGGGAKGRDKGKGVVPVGEDAFVEGQDRSRKVRRSVDDDDDGEVTEPEEVSVMQTEETESQPASTQAKRKRRIVRMPVDNDDDDDE